MRIGIDARLYGETGIGRYISNLIKELEKIDNENDYVIFVTNEGSKKYIPSNPNFKKWILNIPWYSIEEQIYGLKEFIQARLDVLHVPHFNVPVLYSRDLVVTVHDLTMGNFSSVEKKEASMVPFDYKKTGYDFVLKTAINKSKKIITPSKAVADQIVLRYGVKPEKFAITYESVDENIINNIPKDTGVLKTRLEEFQILNKYFLYVGTAYPHKNLNMLVVSFNELLKNQNVSLQLAIAGPKDKFIEKIAAFSHALGLDKKIIYCTRYVQSKYLSDKDLAYLYSGAMAYVFSSLNEGFSITPLEAQASGIPVIISDIPVHREIFGDSAVYFNPKSNIDLTEKMYEVYKDASFRETLIKRGHENVAKYSWERMAKETLEVYKKVKDKNKK
jgi:glycosyltransferase involved in cell wall biosynthesis